MTSPDFDLPAVNWHIVLGNGYWQRPKGYIPDPKYYQSWEAPSNINGTMYARVLYWLLDRLATVTNDRILFLRACRTVLKDNEELPNKDRPYLPSFYGLNQTERNYDHEIDLYQLTDEWLRYSFQVLIAWINTETDEYLLNGFYDFCLQTRYVGAYPVVHEYVTLLNTPEEWARLARIEEAARQERFVASKEKLDESTF